MAEQTRNELGEIAVDDAGAMMILLDTNVVIDAQDARSPFHKWARDQIATEVSSGGAAVNAVSLAELSAGQRKPEAIMHDLRNAGVEILDVPFAAATICGTAYRRYCENRRLSGGGDAPKTPLPDFFIGAHAEIMGWKLVTRDSQRYKAYFPSVVLIEP